jgi:GAF domain-containing protein
MLPVLVEKAAELLKVPAASVMLVDEGRQEIRIRAARGLSPAYVQALQQPLEASIAGRALSEGRVFATWDARQAGDPKVAEAAAREGIVSIACAPMLFAGKPIGVLNVYCHDSHCFSTDQFHVLALLAAQGAVAVTNARLYRDSRAYAAEVRASFGRVGAALASSLDVGETLRLIVQLAVEMTRAEAGAMFMLAEEREGGGLVLSAARGLDRRSVRRFRRMPPSPVAQRALAERRVVYVPDTRRQTDTAFPALRLGTADAAVEARSVVCLPVLVGGRPVGILEQYASEPHGFDKNDKDLLSSFALQAAVAIENARLYAQERNIAQTLQRSFLPELPPAVSGFQIGKIYVPAGEAASVGGDTYDLWTLPDGRLLALIADVCGKGTFAATLTVMAKYTVRAYALEDPDPSRVLARVNDALAAQTDDSTFLTLCCALIDPATRAVTLANAAHPPALLHSARGDRPGCRPLGIGSGLIAGFRPGEQYPAETAEMAPGDVLVFYTDGVTEARKRKTQFEMDRLRRVIEENAARNAQEIASAIYAAVVAYAGENLADDIALLVLKAE